MKFYIHCENPEMTMVVKWDNPDGLVSEALKTFKDNLTKQYPAAAYSSVDFCLKNAKGKPLDLSSKLTSVVKHMEDIYVTIVTTQVEETRKSTSANKADSNATDAEKADTKDQMEEEGSNSELQPKINAALVHIHNKRIRKSILLYKEILKTNPNYKAALLGLGACYQRAGRHEYSMRYAKKGLALYKNDVDLNKLLCEAYISIHDGDSAVEAANTCIKAAKARGNVTTEEKQDLQVLLARAYLALKQRDMALAILQGTLREKMEHEEALLEYAALIYPLSAKMMEDSVNILLSLLARKQKDKRVRRVFSEVMSDPKGMAVFTDVGQQATKDPAALVFLGNILRDQSVVKPALEMFKKAMELDPGNPSIALIYIHTLELEEKHAEIIAFVKEFLAKFGDKSVGGVPYSAIHKHFVGIPDDVKPQDDPIEVAINPETVSYAASNAYTDEERYFLAFLFTAIKVLYIKGALSYLPSMLNLLEPLYKGRQLHESNIRNEAAYFGCINELFKLYPTVPLTQIQGSERYLYFVGDSHCIPTAWQRLKVKNKDFLIHPILSTGTKIWHLRPESVFFPKLNFHTALQNIPHGAMVTVCLGEIDCREALLQCWEQAKYERIEDGMEHLIEIYLRLLQGLQAENDWQIYVHPILPVLDLTRPIVMQFNRLLATRLREKPTLHWLNFVNCLLTDDGENLKPEYKFDGTHLHPTYSGLLSEALTQAT